MKKIYEATYFPFFTSTTPTSLGFFSTHEKAYGRLVKYADENYLMLPYMDIEIKEHALDSGD